MSGYDNWLTTEPEERDPYADMCDREEAALNAPGRCEVCGGSTETIICDTCMAALDNPCVTCWGSGCGDCMSEDDPREER